IVLPSWKQTSKRILVHELVHALQDQRFNLSDLDKKTCRSTDSCMALAALTEGDAVLIDEEYAKFHRAASGEEDKIETGQDYRCEIPEVLTLQGNFAYGFGKLFVKRQKDMGGNEAINEAFMHPPKSTREILQKNDYSAYKGALFRSEILTVEEAPSSIGRKLLYEDTFGQYTIRLMLARSGNQEKAILAAKGWKGDRLGLFKENGDLVMHWKTSWNTYSDAKEFFDLLRDIYSNQLQIPISHQASYFKVENIGYLSVELRQSQKHVVLKLKRFNFELADAS
ncbi:MAG: hypothetical protein GYA55_01220, partial [SAR324 cluster bacterium]|nr:hypothetical protein [SAR324 cluster bacterium]